MKGFTEQEQEIMNRIVEVHNMYVELEKTHPSDVSLILIYNSIK